MQKFPNLSELWARVGNFVRNAGAFKKDLAGVPKIKRKFYFDAKSKRRVRRQRRMAKLEVALTKLRKEEHAEAWEVGKNFDLTEERCDGYLSKSALKKLFGRKGKK